MATDDGTDLERQGVSAPAFWWRLADNAFRRLVWLMIPVVLFAALGFWQASKTLDLYQSGGRLTASTNPLVDQQVGGAPERQYWETPAQASSRTINEQLRTDSFIEQVADRAGLKEAVDAGFLDLVTIRGAVWSSANGTSLVNVNATWGDPQTAFGLVSGTISAYQQYVAASVASLSEEAVAFHVEQLSEFEAEVETAQAELEQFVEDAGDIDADDRSVTVDIQLTRLTSALAAAEAKVAATKADIDEAELAVEQSRSEAGRSLTVIDEPNVPSAPQSTLIERISTIISFTMLGVVIMLAALVIGTVLDQSVASASDLRPLNGVEHVAVVPVLGFDTPRRRRGTRKRRRSEPEPEVERESVGV